MLKSTKQTLNVQEPIEKQCYKPNRKTDFTRKINNVLKRIIVCVWGGFGKGLLNVVKLKNKRLQ